MIIKRARCKGSFREQCWYNRGKPGSPRQYHVFGLSRLVTSNGSCWRLIIGPWAIAFGFKD